LHGRPADDQGRGASVILLEQCLAQARDWGCDVIWLAVWENNPRAMRFYEKNGFRVVGKTLFRLGGDIQHDFVMARNL
jgi:ribosomal protein S18 acetylase RimI-like enzyme